jgi:hypothetical protein
VRPGRLIFAALVVVALAGSGAVLFARRGERTALRSTTQASQSRAPAGVRIRVQVLNGTRTRGLAHQATERLRDLGFDVVEVGTARPSSGDTTIVYDLTGHPDWAALVAANVAPAKVVSKPDSSRYLDVAVVLGAAWRPPSQPFYP